ncbi:type II secretion system protein GspL [Azomonas macrocytogenes]|uniref:Type II secretion system protein L n=1 Tax=Azomonas macrocytogenes TaxID=69962 RepID=A0A839T2M2_AZOMA|nr:type II secretion system protein GspL [Azomonas macrocytogenes]MBB3103239.1 general secretion pathway protein L [Azomonas macrocytogenes]
MDMLFLPADAGTRLTAETPVYWLPDDGPGATLNLTECAAAARGPLALVIPVESCSFFAVQLPTRKARWVEQATAYAVEELLAENVDELHLARGELLADGRNRVVAIRRSLLAHWLGQLNVLGLEATTIHVDADLLPREATQLLFLGTRGLLGGSQEVRLAFATANWPLLAEQCPQPRHAQGTTAEPPEQVETYHLLDEPYRWLAAGRAAAVNLAQGEFATRSTGQGLDRWKPVLALLGLLLLIQLGFTLGQSWYLRHQGDRYADASLAQYRELFPEDHRIINLRTQFDEHLNMTTQSSANFLGLLEQTAMVIAAGTPVVIQQLDYNLQGGGLVLQVSAPDFATLEQFRQQLGENGQAVQLGSANRDGNLVSARVTIGG